MGCFDLNCMISDLPILYNDDVVLIFLSKRIHKISSGPTKLYSPIGFPILGKYNDYGNVHSIEYNYASSFTFNLINENIHENENSDTNNRFHRFYNPSNIEELINVSPYSNYGKNQLDFCMIHREIWIECLKLNQKNIYDKTNDVINELFNYCELLNEKLCLKRLYNQLGLYESTPSKFIPVEEEMIPYIKEISHINSFLYQCRKIWKVHYFFEQDDNIEEILELNKLIHKIGEKKLSEYDL